MRRWVIVNVLLALVVALLATAIARTWAAALRPIAVAPRSPAAPPVAPTPPSEREKRRGDKGGPRAPQTPEAMVALVTEKDLFDPSRRPQTTEDSASGTGPVAKVVDPPTGVTVVGVRIIGKDREVFVSDASAGAATQRRLRLGDEVAGYTVKAIDADAVTLRDPQLAVGGPRDHGARGRQVEGRRFAGSPRDPRPAGAADAPGVAGGRRAGDVAGGGCHAEAAGRRGRDAAPAQAGDAEHHDGDQAGGRDGAAEPAVTGAQQGRAAAEQGTRTRGEAVSESVRARRAS
jgi:hypothetical protein